MKNKKWSYSRWSIYASCPSKYEWFYVKRMPRGTSYALERGKDIHNKAENFVNGKIKGLPDELVRFKKEFKKLKEIFIAGDGFTEPDVSLNSLWKHSNIEQTDFFIGFADFVAFNNKDAVIIDYKTGSKNPRYRQDTFKGHRDQAHVYAMAVMCIDENIDKVEVEFWYLDIDDEEDQIRNYEWSRKDLERMKSVWNNRIMEMYADKKFIATPENPKSFCGNCDRNKKNGGDCDA